MKDTLSTADMISMNTSKRRSTKMDGWIFWNGLELYVEDGNVLRAMKKDRNGSKVPAYPYRAVYNRSTNRYEGWDNCAGISLKYFKALYTQEKANVF